MPETSREPAIAIRALRKAYIEGVPVLDGVDLDVPHGSVTALVGANGSGKSTLVKILSGYHTADEGSEVWVSGERVDGHLTPERVRSLGLRFVHQDSTFVPEMSVLDNMLVGAYRTGPLGNIRWADERRDIRELLTRWGIDADVRANIGSLSLVTAAKLSVLRALRRSGDERISAVILDEPTAALGQDDAAEMLDWVAKLASVEDIGVLLIGHRLEEILRVADRISVLRAGLVVANVAAGEVGHDRLVEHIVGRSVNQFYPERSRQADRTVVLSARGLSGAGIRDLSLDVMSGEIVGITGLPGSGFEDIPSVLIDPETRASGELAISGVAIDVGRTSIAARLRRGLAFVPAERKRLALVTELSVAENLSLPRLRSFIRGGFLRKHDERRFAQQLVDDYHVTPAAPRIAAGRLSGGNQQKVVLAKWLSIRPTVLVLHEPTQAVDVGAKAEIFSLLADAVAAGMSALIISVEYEDLAHLCDRVLVVGNGVVTREFSGDALTADALAAEAFMAAKQTARFPEGATTA